MGLSAQTIVAGTRLAFWTGVACVVTLSLLPTEQLPDQVSLIWDKAQHAGGFALLALLGLAAYPGRAWRVCIGLVLMGAAIELAQQATGWRHGDVADWFADAVGVLAAVALWVGLNGKSSFRSR